MMHEGEGGYREYRDLGVISGVRNPTTDPKHGVEPLMDANGRESKPWRMAAKSRKSRKNRTTDRTRIKVGKNGNAVKYAKKDSRI